MAEKRNRHCWECLHRSLVCDFTQPGCKRCAAAGTLCPGYGEKKPLRLNWLAPGRVKSRTRKSKEAIYDKTELSLGLDDGSKEDRLILPLACLKGNADAALDALSMLTAADNTVMFPILNRNRVGDHPGVYQIRPAHVRDGITRPEYLRLDIVCMVLNHRINSSRDPSYAQTLKPTYYHFRGQVLHSLNQAMREGFSRKGNINFLIAGILSLLLADAHHGGLPHWRFHIEGVQQLIALRGGLRAITGPGVDAIILCYAYITVIGDTSSPATNLAMSTTLLAELDTILYDHSNDIYSFYPFPPPLFAVVVKINHLRARAAARLRQLHITDIDTLTKEAIDILTTIQFFSVQSWKQSHKLTHEWSLLARIVQSAVTIYCISSLQSVAVLPASAAINVARKTCREDLYSNLVTALQTPSVGGSLLWPLVVLGVDAVHDTSTMRAFVRASLGPLAQGQGSFVPLMARDMLERYWASGLMSWDGCFDRPYALAMQWTVTRHGLK
ncbi:fungal-specific transcription factor domain-containing protein [Aspergillus aurantiobrunneus]